MGVAVGEEVGGEVVVAAAGVEVGGGLDSETEAAVSWRDGCRCRGGRRSSSTLESPVSEKEAEEEVEEEGERTLITTLSTTLVV